MIEKTRDLPLLDFFSQLQLEYVVAGLRYRIYKREKDKAFWKDRVMVGKRQKIEDISERNPNLMTIFNSQSEMQRFKDMVYKPWGLPDFYYRDKEQRAELEIKDILNYFAHNQEFLVKTDVSKNEQCILVSLMRNNEPITWANYKEHNPGEISYAKIKVKNNPENTTVHISNLRRIL